MDYGGELYKITILTMKKKFKSIKRLFVKNIDEDLVYNVYQIEGEEEIIFKINMTKIQLWVY